MRVKLHPSIRSWTLGVLIFSAMIAGCGESSQSDTDNSTGPGSKYLFIGHAYNRAAMDNTIDPRLTQIDFNQYDGIWWGGDVTVNPNLSQDQMAYLRTTARMDHPNTLWAFGNHEYDPEAIKLASESLEKPIFHFWRDGQLGVFVFNSSLAKADCENKNDQLNALRKAVKTESGIDQFVFLSHHAIWCDIVPESEIRAVANSVRPNQLLGCSVETTFSDVVQPLLHEMVDRGVQVLCLAGDAGIRPQKNGAWKDDQGIEYVVCGIGDSKDHARDSITYQNDELLVLHSTSQLLSWELSPIVSLSEK